MLYDPKHKLAIPQIQISGRNLAHAQRSIRERALLAADLVAGRAIILPLTIVQAGAICGVSYPTITIAQAAGDDEDARAAFLAGHRHCETLAEHFHRASQSERIDAARQIGPGVIWDSMISPIV
jgi:hypothetical protein